MLPRFLAPHKSKYTAAESFGGGAFESVRANQGSLLQGQRLPIHGCFLLGVLAGVRADSGVTFRLLARTALAPVYNRTT